MANVKILTPVRFAAASYNLRVSVNGTPSTVAVPVTVARDYWMSGDDQADDAAGVGDLLNVLETAIDGAVSGATVDLTTDHNVIVTVPSGTIALLWADVLTTLDPAVFGFTAADTSAAIAVTGTLLPQGIWRSNTPLGPGRDMPVHVAGLARTIAGDVSATYFGEALPVREVTFPALTDAKVRVVSAAATEPLGTLETAWGSSMVRGDPWRLYEDETAQAYSLYKATSQALPWSQHPRHPWYWQAAIQAVRLGTWAP